MHVKEFSLIRRTDGSASQGTAAATARDEGAEETSNALLRSFQGWLSEIAPEKARPQQIEEPKATRLPETRSFPVPTTTLVPVPDFMKLRQLSLTTRDVLGVDRATVRESEIHRVWPKEVVLKMLAAKVIPRKR